LSLILPQRGRIRQAAAGGAVSFVGETAWIKALGTDASLTVDLTEITGLAEDDYVLCYFGDNSNTGTSRALDGSTGWTEVLGLYGAGALDSIVQVWGKVMGATVDTSIVSSRAPGVAFSKVGKAYAFRGVNTTTPTGQITSAVISATQELAIPVITPDASNTFLMTVFGSGNTRNSTAHISTAGDSFDDTDLGWARHTYNFGYGLCYVDWAGGEFDPGTFDGSTETDATGYSAAGGTIELNPA